jgi:hypothetical protein
MSLGPIGNSSSVAQAASEAPVKKMQNNGASAIRIVYGDESKMAVLSAHMNRMAGFYAAIKPMIDSAKGGEH